MGVQSGEAGIRPDRIGRGGDQTGPNLVPVRRDTRASPPPDSNELIQFNAALSRGGARGRPLIDVTPGAGPAAAAAAVLFRLPGPASIGADQQRARRPKPITAASAPGAQMTRTEKTR